MPESNPRGGPSGDQTWRDLFSNYTSVWRAPQGQDFSEFMKYLYGIQSDYLRGKPFDQAAVDTGAPAMAGIRAAGGPGSVMGYGNLLNILAGQGRTDPALMNRNIQDIQQRGSAQQANLGGQLAGKGLQNSGVGMALQQAIGQGTTGQVADVRAREAQLAEERKRSDIDLFLRAIIGPSIDYSALGAGQYGQKRQADQAQKGAEYGFWGNLIGGLAGLYD